MRLLNYVVVFCVLRYRSVNRCRHSMFRFLSVQHSTVFRSTILSVRSCVHIRFPRPRLHHPVSNFYSRPACSWSVSYTHLIINEPSKLNLCNVCNLHVLYFFMRNNFVLGALLVQMTYYAHRPKFALFFLLSENQSRFPRN